MSRGLSNCNPGNIRQSKVRYKGEVQPSRDPAFKQFESLAWGYRGGEVFGPEIGIGACEELFVERPSHDGDDVTLFGSGNVGFGNDLRRQVFPFAEGEFQHLEGCD